MEKMGTKDGRITKGGVHYGEATEREVHEGVSRKRGHPKVLKQLPILIATILNSPDLNDEPGLQSVAWPTTPPARRL